MCPKIFQGKNIGISEDTKKKKLQIVQDYRFFHNPERLKELIEKEFESKYSGYFQGIDYVDFTEEERIEKQVLLDSGFTNWDRRDYQKVCQALELYPREECEAIANHIGSKTAKEVSDYLKVFFEKVETLNDYANIKKKLDRANAVHSFKRQAPVLIKQKVTAYERPVEEMFINVVQKSKYFSKEADIVLLCLTHEHGYGNWQKIKHALKRDTRCRFDHLFMSRTVQELQKRVDILVKSLEKEILDTKNGTLVNGQPVNKRAIKKKESMIKANNNKEGGAGSDDDMALGDRAEIGPDINMASPNGSNEAGEVDADMIVDRELAAEMNVRLGGAAGDTANMADEKLYER